MSQENVAIVRAIGTGCVATWPFSGSIRTSRSSSRRPSRERRRPTGSRPFDVWTIRASRALRVEAYADRAEALEALGLERADPTGPPSGRFSDKRPKQWTNSNSTRSVVRQ